MKILVVGDFHGEFPKKLNKIVEDEKIDLVLSNGDYLPFHYRELWFKHCYTTGIGLWEVIGKKKYKQLVIKDLNDGENAIKQLDELPVPTFTVYGNLDRTGTLDSADMEKYRVKSRWRWDEQNFFSKLIRKYKNIHDITYSSRVFGNLAFIGAYGAMFPGKVKSKSFRKHSTLLDKLFGKNKNFKGKIIFLSHNVPYNTKLDLIKSKGAHKRVRGKHYGSKLINRVIKKWQPLIHIGGHIHEGRGVQRIGKTLCINPGAVHEGQYAIIDIKEGKKPSVEVKLRKI